ncbi:MAG: riboflavin synthase [Oleispira sp.]|jgi:riboflavin synthase
MFTGIIEAVGKIVASQSKQGDIRLRVNTGKLDLSDVKLGDSIATNGVCLTVVELPGDGFWADVSKESITHTNIMDWKSGKSVNLEQALTLATRLGGHMVTGHVDGVGTIMSRSEDARSVRFKVKAGPELSKYIAAKGSITVDGVSLTVNAIADATAGATIFDLNIVPHTVQETVIKDYQVGHTVHLEVDVIARYLERMMQQSSDQPKPGISQAFLAQNGFWK